LKTDTYRYASFRFCKHPPLADWFTKT